MQKKVNIYYKTIYLIILLFPFVQQRSMLEFPNWLVNFYKFGIIFSSINIYVFAIIHWKKIMEIQSIRMFAGMFLLYLFATIINSYGNFFNVLNVAFYSIALTIVISYEIIKNRERLLYALSFIYGGYTILNFIFDIVYPDGFYELRSGFSGHSARLLGDDNAIAYVVLPALIITSIYSLIKYKKMKLFVWILVVCSSYTLIRLWAVSGMVAVVLFGVSIFYILHIGKLNPKFLFVMVSLGITMSFTGIVSNNFSFLIEKLFHKEITLTGRTILWSGALKMIMKKPLLGYGGYYKYGSWRLGGYYYPAHTPYLQMMIDAGIIMLLFFVFVNWMAYRNCYRQKNVIAQIAAMGITCMLINYITEQAYLMHFIVIISIMMNLHDLPEIECWKINFWCTEKR